MQNTINTTVLMSGADHFDDQYAINAYMDEHDPVTVAAAQEEHASIKAALEQAGVQVIKVDPPENCQDGVYTANWALVRGDKAVLANLPNARKGEEPYAEQVLQNMGKTVIKVPEGVRFSGQGDALPCGNLLFMGSGYRTDMAAHAFIADTLGYEVISLQTIPQLDQSGQPVINKFSGWPDSFFYDIDLALSILKGPTETEKGLIAWCPDAFTPASQEVLRGLTAVDKIEVSFQEATEAFACNLVSNGEVAVMSDAAPEFKAAVEAYGLRTITPHISELAKGGGYIRCTSLTLSNK